MKKDKAQKNIEDNGETLSTPIYTDPSDNLSIAEYSEIYNSSLLAQHHCSRVQGAVQILDLGADRLISLKPCLCIEALSSVWSSSDACVPDGYMGSAMK